MYPCLVKSLAGIIISSPALACRLSVVKMTMDVDTGMRYSGWFLNIIGSVIAASLILLLSGCYSALAAGTSGESPLVKGDEGALRKWTREFLPDGVTPGKAEEIKPDSRSVFDLDLREAMGVRLLCSTRESWAGAAELAFEVLSGTGIPEEIRVVVYIKDGDHCWYEAMPARKPALGKNTFFSVPLDDSELWQNVGHGKPMNGYSLLDVRQFGIGVFCEKPMSGKISVGRFSLIQKRGYLDPLRVVEFRESGSIVNCYETLEIGFRLNRTFENPFDPEQVDISVEVTPPSGKKWKVFGFFTQDYIRIKVDDLERLTPEGRPYWAVRIVPREVGEHSYRLSISTPSERFEMKPRDFIVRPSGNKGYVRVSKEDPCHWEFENGDVFYPVGHSVHASYDEHYHTMQKFPKPVHDRRTFFYDEIFAEMGAAGETFTEIWMCPWWVELEWCADWHPYKGLGRYNLENAWCLDHVFTLAEQYDIWLQIALMNHGQLSFTNSDPDWEHSPYYTKNGGFLNLPEEFFTSNPAQKLWRQKLRYVVARWGSSTHLFGWVLVSESDLVGPYSGWSSRSRKYFDWCIETSRYLYGIDPGKHPTTNHYYGNYRHLDKNLFRQPEIGYMACDAYREGRHLIDQLIGTVGLSREIGKPIIVSEYGGDWCGATDNNLIAEQHGGIWASYMIGMTSTPLFWWFEFVDRHDLYDTYLGFSRFIEGEDRRGKPATTQRLEAVLAKDVGTRVNCLARIGSGWLDAWIFEDRGLPYINYYESKDAFYAGEKAIERPWDFTTISGACVAIQDFEPGNYAVEFWNTLTGEVVLTENAPVGSDKRLLIKPPEFTRDIAVKVRPED